jgi:hypothetical protein
MRTDMSCSASDRAETQGLAIQASATSDAGLVMRG